MVIGDGTIGDPSGSGEVLVARYQDVQDMVHAINAKEDLVDWSWPTAKDRYEAAKKGEVVVLSPGIAQELRDDGYSNKPIREKIYRLLTGDKQELIDGNLELVADANDVASDTVSLDNAMGFYPTKRKGLRPLWVWPVDDSNSFVNDYYNLVINLARPVGVAAEPLEAFENYVLHLPREATKLDSLLAQID